MIEPVKFKVNVKTPGLRKANQYLAEELRKGALQVGYKLQSDIRKIQRVDTGAERRQTLFKITSRKGGLNVLLSVYNTSIQGNVDETGAKPHFPPFRKGSKLFAWVQRKGLATLRTRKEIAARGKKVRIREEARAREENTVGAGIRLARLSREKDRAINDKRIEGIAFAIARAISRRGLPRPGDALRKPFETTRKQADNMIRTIFNFATLKAVKRVNDEGGASTK